MVRVPSADSCSSRCAALRVRGRTFHEAVQAAARPRRSAALCMNRRYPHLWRRAAVVAGVAAALGFMSGARWQGVREEASLPVIEPTTFVTLHSSGSTGVAAPRSARRPRVVRHVLPEASLLGDTSWMNDPVVSCLGWCALISGLTVLRIASTDDIHTPSEFLKLRGSAKVNSNSGQPVVCLGDSITRGNLSADWVGTLRAQLKHGLEGSPVLNAGINMQCSKNIHQRIDEVIACRPSHVTVLVGTNDLKAELSPIEGFMYKVFGRLPEVPTLESYERTLLDIREKLVAAGARVALVSPPVLGEDIRSQANERAADFAAVVRRVAESGGEHCSYLPLFERTFAALPTAGGRPYCGMNFFAWCCLLCWDVHVLQRDLADIQRERNLGVTIDLVHLGPEAGQNLASMVHDFVRTAKGPKLAEVV